jgi:hypothetical protein
MMLLLTMKCLLAALEGFLGSSLSLGFLGFPECWVCQGYLVAFQAIRSFDCCVNNSRTRIESRQQNCDESSAFVIADT